MLQIEKDALRTDRDEPFYAGDDNVNVDKLKRLLAIFSLIHRTELPYTQVCVFPALCSYLLMRRGAQILCVVCLQAHACAILLSVLLKGLANTVVCRSFASCSLMLMHAQ